MDINNSKKIVSILIAKIFQHLYSTEELIYYIYSKIRDY